MNPGYGVKGKTKGPGYFTPVPSAAATGAEFVTTIEQQFPSGVTDGNSYHWVDTFLNAQDAYWQFVVPSNFATLVEAYVWIMGDNSVTGTVSVDLEAKYGKSTEQMDLATETNASFTFDIAAVTKRHKVDVSSVLTGIEAGDFVGLKLSNVDAGGLDGIAGILEYNA